MPKKIKRQQKNSIVPKTVLFTVLLLLAAYFVYHSVRPVRDFVDYRFAVMFSKKINKPSGDTKFSQNQNQMQSGAANMASSEAYLAENTNASVQREFKHDQLDPQSLQKFVDPLPLPSVLKPTGQMGGKDYYEISMSEAKQKLHRDMPETTIWGYNGLFPGPTIEARSGVPIKVKWLNNLPYKHFLPIDTSVDGAENPNDPQVRTVIHLHGGHVPPESDGYPMDWFASGGSSSVIDYPNNQASSMLWYHDHAMGITRLNVEAGLEGLYFIRDSVEESMNLPRGDYEVPLVIQDRSFNKDGSLDYPSEGSGSMQTSSSKIAAEMPKPSIVPEFFGDFNLVNGKMWPFLEVEPRKYRFRILNGSNARFYDINLSNGASFYQIGSEAGFLSAPVKVNRLLLAPAERADVIIDFSKFKGAAITLNNDASAPYPSGSKVDANTGKIMRFVVKKTLTGNDSSVLPQALPAVERLQEKDAVTERNIALIEKTDNFGRLMLTIDGKRWNDQATETPKLGTTEIWNIINTTPDTHPIHLHLDYFQILDRRSFNVAQYDKTGKVIFTGKARKPDPNEADWKDTFRANPGEVSRIIVRFTDYSGRYLWHCHILEHEEYEMMRPLEIMP
ncbi:MAG TPA: multicopper oxidase [Patescibacteria group bacterium]